MAAHHLSASDDLTTALSMSGHRGTRRADDFETRSSRSAWRSDAS